MTVLVGPFASVYDDRKLSSRLMPPTITAWGDVSPFDIPELTQAPLKSRQVHLGERSAAEDPDNRHRRLLRARRERPGDRCPCKRAKDFSPSDVDCHATDLLVDRF